MSLYVVDVEPVFGTMVPQVLPLSVDLSILYPVIADPPLLLGVVQDRLISDEDTAVAVNPVGGCGVVGDAVGVAFASFDEEDSPTAFTAVTL